MDHSQKSFVLYTSYWNLISELTDNELGLLFRALYHHILGLPPIDLTGAPSVKMAFRFISEQIARDQVKWQAVREKRRAAGMASGKARREKSDIKNYVQQDEQVLNMFNTNQHNVNVDVDVDVNADVNVDVNVNDNDDVDVDVDVDDVVGKLPDKEERKIYEILYFRNIKYPLMETKRLLDYYRGKNWTLENGYRLGSFDERIAKAQKWNPGGNPNYPHRVDDFFLRTWEKIYLRAKENNVSDELLKLMLDEKITIEKTNSYPKKQHNILVVKKLSEYLNRGESKTLYDDILKEYIKEKSIDNLYVTSTEHRVK